jgi:hypothetical protein
MCFSLLWLIQTLVWVVVVCAVVAIIYKLVPYLMTQLGVHSDLVMSVIKIIVVAIVLISVLVLLYDLVACAGYVGGAGYRRLP